MLATEPRIRPAAKPQLWTVQGDQLRLHFHRGQARAWLSKRRFPVMLAGTQGGKTSFLPLWLHREIKEQGPGDYMAVTSTFPLLKLKLLPEFLRYFQHTLHLGTYRDSEKVFTYHDGKTRIVFGSATHPESLESATAKAAVLDEAGQDQFRLESWEAIQRRLSLHEGRALLGTTVYNLGWLKQRVYDAWRGGNPDFDIIQFNSVTNPAFPRAEYDRAKRDLPAWRFAMFYQGDFARPAGLIYEDYIDTWREEGGHRVKPFELPAAWPRYVGVDFGAVNTGTIWLAHDTEANVYYAYHETHEGGKATAGHVATAQSSASGVNLVAAYGGAKSETQQRMDWGEAGLSVQEPPVSDVEAGIDRVIALFKQHRLYVLDSCAGLLDELGTYSRECDDMGSPTEKIKDKETFHLLDALRYCVAGVCGPEVRVTWL